MTAPEDDQPLKRSLDPGTLPDGVVFAVQVKRGADLDSQVDFAIKLEWLEHADITERNVVFGVVLHAVENLRKDLTRQPGAARN